MYRRFLKTLSDVRVLNITLPILMIYLIVGTIAQKYIGLYEATEQIFYSPIFWIGFIPLPGMPIFMILLTLNLICYVFLKNPFHLEKIGTLISHIGVILLMLGAFYTVSLSKAGYVDLAVKQKATQFSDYHQRELIIRNIKTDDIIALNFQDVGTKKISDIPFKIDVIERCQNCEIVARQNGDETFFGMAQHMQLVAKELDMQNEENMAGLTLKISGSDNDGIYVVLEEVPQYPTIMVDGNKYRIELNKLKHTLPFVIELVDFRRDKHPGTMMAKAYESDVLVTDGTVQWESTIRMNEPLRYKGYTFFQSSYIDTPLGPRSVFSVVQNTGRAFPYIAGFAICLGIFLHLLFNITPLKKRGK